MTFRRLNTLWKRLFLLGSLLSFSGCGEERKTLDSLHIFRGATFTSVQLSGNICERLEIRDLEGKLRASIEYPNGFEQGKRILFQGQTKEDIVVSLVRSQNFFGEHYCLEAYAHGDTLLHVSTPSSLGYSIQIIDGSYSYSPYQASSSSQRDYLLGVE